MKKFDEIHNAYHLAKQVLAIHYGEQHCLFCDGIILKPNNS